MYSATIWRRIQGRIGYAFRDYLETYSEFGNVFRDSLGMYSGTVWGRIQRKLRDVLGTGWGHIRGQFAITIGALQ